MTKKSTKQTPAKQRRAKFIRRHDELRNIHVRMVAHGVMELLYDLDENLRLDALEAGRARAHDDASDPDI